MNIEELDTRDIKEETPASDIEQRCRATNDRLRANGEKACCTAHCCYCPVEVQWGEGSNVCTGEK